MFRRLVVIAALCGAASPVFAQAPGATMAGTTWVLCGGDTQAARDALVFDADGNGTVIRAQGNVAFRYQRAAAQVALTTRTSRQAVLLDVIENGEVLVLRAPNGEAAAHYARQGSAAMARCPGR